MVVLLGKLVFFLPIVIFRVIKWWIFVISLLIKVAGLNFHYFMGEK